MSDSSPLDEEVAQLKQELPSRLRDVRLGTGDTQEEFAERLDVDSTTVWRIENGKSQISIETLLKYSIVARDEGLPLPFQVPAATKPNKISEDRLSLNRLDDLLIDKIEPLVELLKEDAQNREALVFVAAYQAVRRQIAETKESLENDLAKEAHKIRTLKTEGAERLKSVRNMHWRRVDRLLAELDELQIAYNKVRKKGRS